jgi:hypothetical protein
VGPWGLGFGPQPPIPNPQSPIPNPQSPNNEIKYQNIFIIKIYLITFVPEINKI